MKQYRISAVGVVDQSGVLIGNLSISNLRGLSKENFSCLLLPVMEYLRLQAGEQAKILPYSVKSTNTFGDVVRILAEHKLHRVWVVDDFDRPQGLISLTDIMNVLDLRVYIDQTDKGIESQ
jgi:CBS domain-containing protein